MTQKNYIKLSSLASDPFTYHHPGRQGNPVSSWEHPACDGINQWGLING